jgi:prepilin-type N-terminal cleavage/methylation domain-containing protein
VTPRRREAFTLIEMLIAAAIAGIVGAFLMRTFTANHRAYVVVDQVAESQQSMRAVAELLERDARHAGFMVPEAAAACGVDSTTGPDLLYLSDSDAIDPQDDKAIYPGAKISGQTNVGPGNDDLDLDSLIIEPSPPSRPAYDTNGDGTNDSDFQVGAGVIVIDAEDPSRGSACGRVVSVDLTNDDITVEILSAPLKAAGGAVDLRVIPAHQYAIDGTDLERDGRLLSGGVEDLQIAYFFDANGNWTPDAGEYRGVSGANYSAQAEDADELREIRVNLVVRSRQEDAQFTGGLPQELENRSFGGSPPSDGYRRRVHTARLMLRNLGSRL